MKKLIGLIIIGLSFTIAGYAQTTDSSTSIPSPPVANCITQSNNPECAKVTVTQGFVDDAAKAFDLVVAQRDQINQLLNERSMNQAERAAWTQVKASLDAVIVVQGNLEASYKALDAVKDKIIKIQNDWIDTLQTKIMKKKSTFDKILEVLKEATILLAGAAIGHVLP